MPEALLFTSTSVMGWILPVATTDRATSPRVTLASLLGSMVVPFTSFASPTPATRSTTTAPTLNQIQNLLLLRDAATKPPCSRSNAACLPDADVTSEAGNND